MAYQPTPPDNKPSDSATDDRDPGLAIPTKITTSQQSVLDQLHNHVAFSETLIFLSGPEGAGKSTILEVFLEQASDYANLAFSPDPGKSSADALRTKLLRQLVTLDAYSTDDSLLEALQRNVKPGRQHLLICIDNGPSLPGKILSELQELVSSRHLFNPEHRLSVVIAGDSGWVKRASKGVALGNSEPPVLVEVPAFFKREQQWFARKLIATQHDQNEVVDAKINALDEDAINALLNQTQGFPGQIQAQLEEQLLIRPYTEKAMQARNRKLATHAPQKRDTAQRKQLSANQLVALLVVFAALVAVAIAAWLHTRDDSDAQVTDNETTSEAVSAPVLPVEATVTNDVTDELTQELTDERSNEDGVAAADEDTDSSAPVMEYEQAMQRLRERAETQPPPREVQFQLVQPVNYLQQQTAQSESSAEADADAAGDSSVSEPADPSPTQVPVEEDAGETPETPRENLNPWLQAYDNLDLWQRDADRYVFQAAAFNSEPRLMQFLAGFDHPEMAIYQTLRQQQTWYMVVIGDFASANAARAYLAGNEDLQSLQPWLKAVRLVHEDLAPVMNNSAQDNN